MLNFIWFLASNPCDDVNVLRVVYIMKEILSVIFILVPIVLIVLVMIDLAKNVIAANEDDMKKSKNLAIKRIIYAVVIFLVPTIVSVFMSVVGDLGVDYSSCMNVTKDTIAMKIESKKNSCTASDMEWNEVLSKCVKKRNYSKIDPNSVSSNGHGGLSAKQDEERNETNQGSEVSNGGSITDIKYYNQCSQEWTSKGFCDAGYSMCDNGCGATAIAMIAATYGNNSNVDPINVRDYLCSNGLHKNGALGYDAFVNQGLLSNYGLSATEFISYNDNTFFDQDKADSIKNNVDQGRAVILLIPGHYVVIGKNSKCTSDEVFMYDPASSADSQCYTMQSLWDKTRNRKDRCNTQRKCGWRRAWYYTKA